MMTLHEDNNAFKVLLDDVHERTGYRLDVLEKEYYVVLVLEELAQKQENGLKAYFKGGTALYKALKTTNRFSEDIDLSVDARECSRTQSDKRLEQATKKYASLERSTGEGRTNRSEVISVYLYNPVVPFDSEDALQRFGKLKVEATSFTISEPVKPLEISAMIFDLATEEQKKILSEQYGVHPFSIQTITLERLYIDKLFAAEAYVRKSKEGHRAFEAAKHIYDLAVMAEHPQILALYQDENQMRYLLDIRMREEKDRLDGIPDVAPYDFTFFNNTASNKEVQAAYEIMQNQYVLRDRDRIPFKTAVEKLQFISAQLNANRAWNPNPPTQRSDAPKSIRQQLSEIKKAQATAQSRSKPHKDRGAR